MKKPTNLVLLAILCLLLNSCTKVEGDFTHLDHAVPFYSDLDFRPLGDTLIEDLSKIESSLLYRINYIGQKDMFFITLNARILAFHSETGKHLWTIRLDEDESRPTVFAVYDYEDEILILTNGMNFLVDTLSASISKQFNLRDLFPAFTSINGLCLEDGNIYVLSTIRANGVRTADITQIDLNTLQAKSIYQRDGIDDHYRVEYHLPLDESRQNLIFPLSIASGFAPGHYILKVNRFTGEEAFFFCGTDHSFRAINMTGTFENLYYHNNHLVYYGNSRPIVYSFLTQTAIRSNISSTGLIFDNTIYQWSPYDPLSAFNIDNINAPKWAPVRHSHRFNNIGYPFRHPKEDILLTRNISGLRFIDGKTGRLLYTYEHAYPNGEFIREISISSDGTKIILFTTAGNIRTYNWPL